MKQLPRGGLLGKAHRVMERLRDYHIPNYAAGTCYFLVLSVFPALVLILGLLSVTNLTAEDLLELLGGMVPSVLLPAISRLIHSTINGASGALVSVSAVTALWSASRGIYGIALGLDGIYGGDGRRSGFQGRLLSVFYTFLFMLVLLLTLVLHVFGTTILSLLPVEKSNFLRFLTEVIDLRFFLLLFVQTALFTAMYLFLPTRRSRLREALPGALLSSIGWLVFSDMFSIYVENFNRYANIYGSVYTVALAMLWLYFCISILFYGGALNRFLMEAHEEKS